MNLFQNRSGKWIVRPDGLLHEVAGQIHYFDSLEAAQRYLTDIGLSEVFRSEVGFRFAKP
jgi:hypothetical protein